MDFARRIRASMDDFAAGDMASTLALWHPKIRWYAVGHSPLAGKFVGHDETLAYLASLRRLTDGTFRREIVEVRPMFGETYVARLTVQAEAGGRRLDTPSSLIMDVEDDHLTSIVELHHDEAAWDSFWTHAAGRAAGRAVRPVAVSAAEAGSTS
jgi:ketosteroid isomerase-like protein